MLSQSHLRPSHIVRWNPARLRQAQDRVWRIGSPHKAVYTYSFFSPRVDERVLAVMAKKEAIYVDSIRKVENTVTAASLQGGKSARASDRDVALIQQLKAARAVIMDGCEPMPHQKVGIRWMQRQERGENPDAPGVTGGILADDMGLGKTYQMLSVVMLDHAASGTKEPTLISMPKSVFNSWMKDAEKFFPVLRVHKWHKKGRISPEQIEGLAIEGPLVVITNESHLKNHNDQLSKVKWRRVVLDESQRINNKKNDFTSALALSADFKWSLSGTPIENKLEDFEAHLQLIGAAPQLKWSDMTLPKKLQGVLMRRTKVCIA